MANTGSLIELHTHSNLQEVLEFLSDHDGQLYYKNAPVYIQVSQKNKNAITTLPDGIFVDSSYFLTQKQYEILSQFSFNNSELKFGTHIISWDYTDEQLQAVNNEIWAILNEEYPLDETE